MVVIHPRFRRQEAVLASDTMCDPQPAHLLLHLAVQPSQESSATRTLLQLTDAVPRGARQPSSAQGLTMV
jgi:hypothetical protein